MVNIKNKVGPLQHDMAFMETVGLAWGIVMHGVYMAKSPLDSCGLPRHDVGGGGFGVGHDAARVYGPWHDSAGGMNTKSELPDLPATASPLQFMVAGRLHLSSPVMKDISGAAGWWWECTLREAKCHYERWKGSTPFQRIQIRPQLPESVQEPRFQRTEQRGVQMLLKAIPDMEQQALVTDRALSSTAILYRLMVRLRHGGAGEKQLLLKQLTDIPALQERPRPRGSGSKLGQTFWPSSRSQSGSAGWCLAGEGLGWTVATSGTHGSVGGVPSFTEQDAIAAGRECGRLVNACWLKLRLCV